MTNSVGVLKQVANDFLEIGSLAGVGFVWPVLYETLDANGNPTGPYDLTGKTFALELCEGYPESPGAVLYRFDETPADIGSVTVAAPAAGVALLRITPAGAAEIAVRDYAFRWKVTDSTGWVSSTVHGRWRHRAA